jgi:protein ImuB
MDFSERREAPNPRRILALWLPRLPTDRFERRTPSNAPFVVSARANNALYIHALNIRAQRLGLYKGQPLANAQAMVQPLTVTPADEKADAALLEKIADWCDRFTPFVALDTPDGLLLDITGAAHLFGGEAAMLTLVRRKIADQGFAVTAAIAGTAPAARALARFADGHIAAPGLERDSLARLPVAALECDDKIKRALERAGLKSIAQVMARQRSELAARFGKIFVATLDVLLGRHDKPIDPRRPLPDLTAEQRFADPITVQSAIAASLASLTRSLSDVLEQRGLGLRTLEAVFFRADGAVRRIGVRLGAPLRDADVLLRLLDEKLEALADPLDPGFGYDVIRLEAGLAEKTQSAVASFDSDENADWQTRFLIDRLSARFGEHRVLSFVPQDTHIPEAAGVAVPAQDRDFQGVWRRKREAKEAPRRPLRLLEQPEEITAIAGLPDDPPRQFRWRRAQFEIAHAEGPERIAMEWWRNDNPVRDYFRVETREGGRFWLYRNNPYDGLAARWFLQGIFA